MDDYWMAGSTTRYAAASRARPKHGIASWRRCARRHRRFWDGRRSDVGVVVPVRVSRPLWRSPAGALLAAASIAGIIALVRAVDVDGSIPEVPGQRVARRNGTDRERPQIVAPAAVGPTTATLGGGTTRVAKVQFVFVDRRPARWW